MKIVAGTIAQLLESLPWRIIHRQKEKRMAEPMQAGAVKAPAPTLTAVRISDQRAAMGIGRKMSTVESFRVVSRTAIAATKPSARTQLPATTPALKLCADHPIRKARKASGNETTPSSRLLHMNRLLIQPIRSCRQRPPLRCRGRRLCLGIEPAEVRFRPASQGDR